MTQSLQELFSNVFEFVATVLWIFGWLAVAGGLCWFAWYFFRTLRRYIEDKHERELLDRWRARNKLIADAVGDLDSPDELQRELAQYYVSSLLP